jgi:alpha-aminoadipate carrier protein LysW
VRATAPAFPVLAGFIARRFTFQAIRPAGDPLFLEGGNKCYCKINGAAVRLTTEFAKILIRPARPPRASIEISLEVEEVPTGTCPECDADVHVDLDVDKGETVDCEECGVQLEVVGLDPVELDLVEEESLDDDDDDDEF